MLPSRTCALLTFVVSLFAPATASAVELLLDNRQVQEFSDGGNTTTTPDAPFADFNAFYQNTTVSNALFSGSGSGYGESDFSFYIAESTFDVTFGVDNDTEISLSGSFGGFPGDFGFAEVTVMLFSQADSTTPTLIYADSIQADFEFVEGDFQFDGVLAAGVHRLVIDTNITPGGFNTDAFFNFQSAFTESVADSDGDGVGDNTDNCTLVVNADQTDTDEDGYGNACDADFNNDCVVNFLDLNAFADAFLTTLALFDINTDGAVNFLDYSAVTDRFLTAPGPGVGVCE